MFPVGFYPYCFTFELDIFHFVFSSILLTFSNSRRLIFFLFIQALRASRQAETIIETVPFDSCRSCVAGLMVVVVVVVVRFLSLRFVCWLRKWCRWYAGGCMDFRLELWFPLGLLQVPFWTRLGVF